MNKKRLLLLWMVLMLTLSTAQARESIPFSFPYSVGTGRAQTELSFQPEWFGADAHAYHHGLCRLSLGMALAAFRGDASAPDQEIRSFFESLGFFSPSVEQFDVTRQDTIGTAIAHRLVEIKGETFPVVAIAVSGGNYGDEWLSNFDTGVGDVHHGFEAAAKETVRRAEEYIGTQGLENARFWISGYSRGAAVSNLAAALLVQKGLAEDSRVFAYTFAPPRTVRGGQAATHSNIFNIVNAADLVPCVPLAAWGYGRYGRTLYLPSSLDASLNYPALLPAYAAAYEKLTGQAPDPVGDEAFAAMAAAAAGGLAISAPTPEKYVAHYQAVLGKVFLEQELTGAEQVLLLTLLMNMGNAALRDSGVVIRIMDGLENALQALQDMLPIFYQHMPEIYFSWLLALPDGEALLQNSLTLTDAPAF